MGRDVADLSRAAREIYARADDALSSPISRLCFEGPLDALTLTENTQPAIIATSMALLAGLIERMPDLPSPSFVLGHSLGEYSALVAAGAMSLEDAVRICRLRGVAMQEAVPPGLGAMAAMMGLDAAAVGAICEQAASPDFTVAPANFNAPGQTVIAGHRVAVERAIALAAQRGGKAVLLKVSAPFHCALMRPAKERLRPALEQVRLSALKVPVIANVNGSPNHRCEAVCELLLRQVDGPIQWVRSVERLAQEGVTHALEIGPGRVLAGLVRRIAKGIKVLNVSDAASIDQVRSFLDEASAQ